jgi:uncharacterized protein YabN with tetrapyrrole methylase and pyrophosphatase domain
VGFDWSRIEDLLSKLEEEIAELREELKQFPGPGPRPGGKGVAGSGRPQVPDELRTRLEEEVGDLFFVLVNIARYLTLDSESALRKANRKFKRRFTSVEDDLRNQGKTLEQASLDEMEGLWQQAKRKERQR